LSWQGASHHAAVNHVIHDARTISVAETRPGHAFTVTAVITSGEISNKPHPSLRVSIRRQTPIARTNPLMDTMESREE
jgi:hypothetical protein